MRILFLGDVVGEAGLLALEKGLSSLKKQVRADFVIINGENASYGSGLFEKDYQRILASGADCVTLGNHYHGKPDIDYWIDEASCLVRPRNIFDYERGQGTLYFEGAPFPIAVTNILGTAFMKDDVLDPVQCFEEAYQEYPDAVHIVDYHAESTSEKKCFAYLCKGKATVVVGTHTHVKSDDCQIIDHELAFMTDLGLCGDAPGIIGFDPNVTLDKVRFGKRIPFLPGNSGHYVLQGCVVEIDDDQRRPLSIEGVNKKVEGGQI